MSYIKRQSIHSRKIGDKTFILTSDGDMEMNLTEGKEFRVNANMITTGDTTGPKVTNVYYVTEDGNDENDGRSADKNGAFASIKRASEVAPIGSTIIVAHDIDVVRGFLQYDRPVAPVTTRCSSYAVRGE